MRYLYYACISILFFSACSKDETTFPIEPEITLLSAGPTTITEFEDSIQIVIQYRDGDGDIGFENPDSFSLFVQDARLPDPDNYFVRPLSPIGSNVSIEGTLEINIRNTFLLGSGGQETTYYTIVLRDRAGHYSNILQTPDITIIAQ